jgi:hypothetical protein
MMSGSIGLEESIMSKVNNQRRILLQGAVAIGSAWCLNAIARTRAPLADQVADAAASGQSSASHEREAAAKISQAQAKYQGQPDGVHMCANCQNFIAPHTCKVVQGSVEFNGWCTLWTKKVA